MKRKELAVLLYALPVTAASIVALALLACPAAQACIGVDGTVPPWGGSGPNGVMAAKIADAWAAAAEAGAKYPIPLPVSGTQKAVIILIQNQPTGVTFDNPAIGNWTGRLAAIAGYYTEVSKGIFTIAAANETHGTFNDGVIGPLDIGGLLTAASDIDWTNSEAIAVAAIQAADPFINFAAFDTNIPADGTITPDELHIMIYQAGDEKSWFASNTPRAWAHNLWHTPQLTGLGPPNKPDGKNIISYSYCGEELNDLQIAPMGQMTHELGHDIGLPDLYDTTGNEWDGLGDHCLMSGGSWGTNGGVQGDTPCHLDGYFKNWLGWGDLIQAVDGSQTVSLDAAKGSNDVFRVDIPGTSEFFIIENRQQTGYDLGLPGSLGGLAIYHCDWDLLDPASPYFIYNEVNGYPTGSFPGPGMKLEEAHGLHFDLDFPEYYAPDPDRGKDNDYYRLGLNTNFDDASDPDSDEKDGTPSGVDASNVSASGDPMTFDIDAPVGQGGEGEGEGEAEAGIRFSVDTAAIGVQGSAVNQNSVTTPPALMADIYAGWNDTNGLSIPLARLGLQPGDDVDAIDIPDQNSPNMEMHEYDVFWHFGVDTLTVGVAGAAPDVFSEASANEAAGDIFWSQGAAFGWPVGGGNVREVEEHWIGLLDGTVPPEDNKDALDISGPVFLEQEPLPLNAVYFSLKQGSPTLAGIYSPADIFASNGSGGFYVAMAAATLGLLPMGDDVDALFMDRTYVPYFSLAPLSPTLGAFVGPQGSPADIFYRALPIPVRAITAAQLGLKVDDNVDALDATLTLIEGAEGEGEEGEGEEGEGEEFEFTKLPIGGWFEVGDHLTLTVEVSVQSATYHWVKDGLDIDEVANPSAVTSVFEIASLIEGDEGWYVCRVTYNGGKTDYLTPAVHVEVFVMLPAVGLAALIAGGLVLTAIGALRMRRKN
ncbi:MAG: M6 family metalloprotease domain-containing protein [Candidatus Hydrogenedentes bacterium]|nr:M6 family metalloprotease domain-containing protein [Candidatus Hydrogenedentota bacterium]